MSRSLVVDFLVGLAVYAVSVGPVAGEPIARGVPPDLVALLSEAYSVNEDIGYCSQELTFAAGRNDFGMDSPWQQTFEAGLERAQSAIVRAESLFGEMRLNLDAGYDAANPPKCDDAFVRQADRRSGEQVSAALAMIEAIEAPTSRGLWVGLFPLCRGTVAEARTDVDPLTSRPVVRVEIVQARRAEFRNYSARFVNKQMAVRLNGVTIQKPTVREPLSRALWIAGGAEEQDAAVLNAALGACPT